MKIVAKLTYLGLVVTALTFLTACNYFGNKDADSTEQTTGAPQIGDRVPNNLVCMVNNAYMGVPQLEVPYEGKTYYGCCEMCQERIPKEKTARVAVDLYTLRDVDKA